MTQQLEVRAQGGLRASPSIFRHRGERRRSLSRRALLAAALVLAVLIGGAVLVRVAAALVALSSAQPVREALEAELAAAPADVRAFYEQRELRPVWVQPAGLAPARWKATLSPEARQLASFAAPSGSAAAQAVAAAETGAPKALAHAELALSLALGDYVKGLQPRAPAARLAFVDPDLAMPATTGGVLARVVQAPSRPEILAALAQVNPIYQALNRQLADYRAQWSRLPQTPVAAGPTLAFGAQGERVAQLRRRLGLSAGGGYDEMLEQAVRRFQTAHALEATGEADAATVAALNAGAGRYERLIQANLERAKALPAVGVKRFVLINPASGELQLYEDGQPTDAMKVVIGTRETQTPMMAGLMRYIVVNPYWNVPVDLVKTSLAPKVLREGPGYIEAHRMQVLSGWDDGAYPIDPRDVDWAAVAAGRDEVRVRQTPGGDNMMGQLKFMLPNELGIYLHDTPEKQLFGQALRLMSAGCVRLEDAGKVAGWALGDDRPDPSKFGADQRVDLAAPIPVYISYLTAAPGAHGVEFHPDVYGRDPALLAQLR